MPVSGNGRPLHKFRFKLDSGAHGNLIPKSMFQQLYPGLPYSDLRKSIDKWVTLVAYNKQEIKQLGQCCVRVCNSSMGKSKTCKFFVVEDKCNPIIGLNDSIALQLLTVMSLLLTNGQVMCILKYLILGMTRWRLKKLVSEKASLSVTTY